MRRLLFVVLVCLWSIPASAQTFTCDFSDPNANGSNLYCFGTRSRQLVASGLTGSGTVVTSWTPTHMATGDYDGSGAVHILLRGCASQSCTDNYAEGLRGYTTPRLGGNYTQGTSRYFIRTRIRFDNDQIFPDDTDYDWKWILRGSSRSNARTIVKLEGIGSNDGCSPDFGWNFTEMGAPGGGIFYRASHWGYSSWSDRSIASNGGLISIAPHTNIFWNCSGPSLLFKGNHPSPKVPNHVGAVPVNGWYWIQIEVISGTCGNSGYKVWVNDGTYATPTTERLNLNETAGRTVDCELDVAGWEGVVDMNYVMLRNSARDIGYRMGHFAIGTSFDAAFAPGGSTPATPRMQLGIRGLELAAALMFPLFVWRQRRGRR